MIDVQHGPSGPKGQFACYIPKPSWTKDSIGVQMVVDARLQQGCLGRGLVQCHCFLHPVCSGIQTHWLCTLLLVLLQLLNENYILRITKFEKEIPLSPSADKVFCEVIKNTMYNGQCC